MPADSTILELSEKIYNSLPGPVRKHKCGEVVKQQIVVEAIYLVLRQFEDAGSITIKPATPKEPLPGLGHIIK